jgi:hypothetical protein
MGEGDVAKVDPREAGLEAQLDRLDEDRSSDDREVPPDRGDFDPDADGFGFHLDDPEVALDPLADPVEAHGVGVGVEVLDALLTAFNHRDLEDLLAVVAPDGEAPGLLGYDRDNLGDAVADLWARRPSVQLTRGELDGGHVGVLWEHDGAAWWQIAVVTVDDVEADRIGVLEFADDPDLLDRVRTSEPDEELLEGERWQEWDDGSSD